MESITIVEEWASLPEKSKKAKKAKKAMKTRRNLVLLSLLLFGVGMPACSKKGEGDGGFYDGAATGGYGADGAGGMALPDRDEGASFFGPGSGNVTKGQFAPVYFEFDSFSVNEREMAKVREVATFARKNGSRIIVAGFTDGVGTEEYNRGLGDRRALAVRGALVANGVGAGSIQTVSFGEEMLADASDPASGANRRVEFGIVK